MHKLVEGLDFDFSRSKSSEEKEGMTDQAIFVLAYFFAALSGEEIFKLVLGEVRDYLLEVKNNRIQK